jgi:transposase
MPRTYLNEANKLTIVELRAKNWSILEISKKIKKKYGTIRSFLQRYKKSKTIKNGKSTGRPPKLSAKTRRQILRHMKTHRRDTVSKIRQDLAINSVSRVTINRLLTDNGFKSHKLTRKPHLTPQQIKARLKWARKYASENEDFFERWIFSDESSFMIGSTSGQRVRRDANEGLLPECVGGSKKWGTKLFFWGAICVHGVSDLVFIDGKMDSDVYIEVLKEGLLPMYRRHGLQLNDMTFQEDGDPKHQSSKTIKWKEKTGLKFLINWPANSPDLNPIDNLWAMLKKAISLKKPVGVEATKQLLLQEWLRLEADGVVMNLIRSMPRRIRAVIQSKGNVIDY